MVINKISCSFYDVCNSIRRRCVSPPQGIRNSDTYPFEAPPHHHSSSLCQNYFVVRFTRLPLSLLHATLVLTVICNKRSFFPEHPPDVLRFQDGRVYFVDRLLQPA